MDNLYDAPTPKPSSPWNWLLATQMGQRVGERLDPRQSRKLTKVLAMARPGDELIQLMQTKSLRRVEVFVAFSDRRVPPCAAYSTYAACTVITQIGPYPRLSALPRLHKRRLLNMLSI